MHILGLGSDFFNWFQYHLNYILGVMYSTVIFNAYGYTVTLWDLYTTSTTLIAFFDSVVFPFMSIWHLTNDDEESISDTWRDDEDDLKR